MSTMVPQTRGCRASSSEGHAGQATASAPRGLVRYAWGTLAGNVGVILWGAYVRASGSGAGCGKHWPLCNGEVIPHAPKVQTLVELTHRLTSGLALISVLVLLVWTFRATVRRHAARLWAVAAAVLMLDEALLGASLVLFEHVAQDRSAARAVWLSLHLVNTFLLLAALAVAAKRLGAPAPERRPVASPWRMAASGVGLAAMIVVGVTGAIAALGDTLFRATSLRSSIAADFSATSEILLRLRVLHPVCAVLAAVYLCCLVVYAVLQRRSRGARTLGLLLLGLVVTQVALGVANIVLLAPVWLQIVHLLFGDLVWITLVLLASEPAMWARPESEASHRSVAASL